MWLMWNISIWFNKIKGRIGNYEKLTNLWESVTNIIDNNQINGNWLLFYNN